MTSFVTTAEYCNIMHADGAGTKSSLAYMYWKETGDVSVWRGIAQDAIIMNLDDLLCVGATDNILLSSTIGRNKNLIPGPVVSALISGTEEVLQMLRDNDVNIVSTGGETADVGDLVRTVIVDSTVTCRCCICLAVSNLTASVFITGAGARTVPGLLCERSQCADGLIETDWIDLRLD